jgi:hypothetical protein
MRNILLLAAAVFISFSALGAEPPKAPAPPSKAVPPPPPLPERSSPSAPAPAEPDSGLEPEVTITTRGDTKYEEYRINGRLYMIKVTPKVGKPYYLIDDDGAGQFRRSDLEPRISVPRWTIKSW